MGRGKRQDSFSEDDVSLLERDRIQEMVQVYGVESEDGTIPGFWTDLFCLKDFSKPMLKIWLPRVFVCLLIHFAGLYINNVSQAWLQANISGYYGGKWAPIPPETTGPVLWDVTFHALPYVNSTKPADILAGVPMSACVIRFLVIPGPMSLRWTIMCRTMVIWGMMWFFRAMCIVTTPLPNPDKTCVPVISFPDNIWLEAWANLPINTYNELTCQDVMFSGHTVGLTLGGLTLCRNWSRAPWCHAGTTAGWGVFLDVVVTLVVIIGMYFIIASHFHYTVDVLVACILTVLTFDAYHTAIEMCWRKRQHLFRVGFSGFLMWLEGPSKDNKLWRREARFNRPEDSVADSDEDTEKRDLDLSDGEETEETA